MSKLKTRMTITAKGAAAQALFDAMTTRPNDARSQSLRRRMMRIGVCLDLAGIDACEDCLPEELEGLLGHSLDELRSALGEQFSELMDEVDDEGEFDRLDYAMQFSYAVGRLGISGFLIRAEQQYPPDGGGWGSYSCRLFYAETYDQAVAKALKWGRPEHRERPAPGRCLMSRLQAIVTVIALRARDQVELVHMLLIALALYESGASAARAIAVATTHRQEVGHA